MPINYPGLGVMVVVRGGGGGLIRETAAVLKVEVIIHLY